MTGVSSEEDSSWTLLLSWDNHLVEQPQSKHSTQTRDSSVSNNINLNTCKKRIQSCYPNEMKFKLQYRVDLLRFTIVTLMWALGNREHCSRITMAVPENLLLSHQTKELNNHPVLFHICVTIRIQSKQVFMHVFKFMLFDTLESLVCVECFDCGCSTK